MTPPNDYFRRCDADAPGAQQVGFGWFVFADVDALSRMLNDGWTNAKAVEEDCASCDDKDGEIQTLEDSLASAKDELTEAKAKIKKLERKLKEAKA